MKRKTAVRVLPVKKLHVVIPGPTRLFAAEPGTQ
jgi:hypothetical protein